MKQHPTHYWPTAERDGWINAGPSRRLRKLYRALAAVETRMADAHARSLRGDHGPSDWVYYCQEMKPLRIERDGIIARIALIQNQEEGLLVDRRRCERRRA